MNAKQKKAKDRQDGLIGLHPVLDLLSLALWSGQVLGERPVSVIIVAPVATGKTSLLERVQCAQAKYFSDLTTRDISRALQDQRLTHIILGDMLSLFGHKSSVVSLTCKFLSSLTGETVRTDSFSGQEISGRALGLLTAIPPEEFNSRKVRDQMEEGGLSSRFLIARYRYRIETITAIHDYIESDAYVSARFDPLAVRDRRRKIIIPAGHARYLRNTAMQLLTASKQDRIGTRPHHHLRTLAKASALQSGRGAVTGDDLERVYQHVDFFRPEGREL